METNREKENEKRETVPHRDKASADRPRCLLPKATAEARVGGRDSPARVTPIDRIERARGKSLCGLKRARNICMLGPGGRAGGRRGAHAPGHSFRVLGRRRACRHGGRRARVLKGRQAGWLLGAQGR